MPGDVLVVCGRTSRGSDACAISPPTSAWLLTGPFVIRRAGMAGTAAAMPGPGLGAGIGTLGDADGDECFLAELARDFLQSGASLELPASLGDFASFLSPGLDHAKQARPRLGGWACWLEHVVCRRILRKRRPAYMHCAPHVPRPFAFWNALLHVRHVSKHPPPLSAWVQHRKLCPAMPAAASFVSAATRGDPRPRARLPMPHGMRVLQCCSRMCIATYNNMYNKSGRPVAEPTDDETPYLLEG